VTVLAGLRFGGLRQLAGSPVVKLLVILVFRKSVNEPLSSTIR
jgi:hypothetical protein